MPRGQIVGQPLQQTLTILGTRPPLLLEFDDASPDLPVGRRQETVD